MFETRLHGWSYLPSESYSIAPCSASRTTYGDIFADLQSGGLRLILEEMYGEVY
jgi:hypothetical protein